MIDSLESIGRTRLAHTPTPLFAAPGLATHLGARGGVLIKADDWTGFGLGGNKVRKLEYELAPARLAGVTHLITSGGPQSNHCRVTAAAAAHLGLACILVVNGQPKEPRSGNALLHRLLGAQVLSVPQRADRPEAMEECRAEVEANGGKALIIPLGASTSRGALGYVHALREIHDHMGTSDPPDIFVAASSGGTLAGLMLGAALLDWTPSIVAVSADDPADTILDRARSYALGAAALFPDPDRLASGILRAEGKVSVRDDFVGRGYGVASPESTAAISTFGRYAGVVLDPVYTAKAAAAMLSLVDADSPTVFLHTGGHPALFT